MTREEMERIARAYGTAKCRHDAATALDSCTDDCFLEALAGERVFFDMATLFRQGGLPVAGEEARVA